MQDIDNAMYIIRLTNKYGVVVSHPTGGHVERITPKFGKMLDVRDSWIDQYCTPENEFRVVVGQYQPIEMEICDINGPIVEPVRCICDIDLDECECGAL